MGKAYGKLDERKKKALFYAALALEEAFDVYRSALREAAAKKAVQRVEIGEEPFKKVVYAADLKRLRRLAEEEEEAFGDALKVLRERLTEYAVKYGLRDLLDVKEGVARELAEAGAPELSEFNDVSFGVKALAALMAYREYALGRRGVFGVAAGYWLEMGGSARLLYYAPWTAYLKTEKAKKERPAAVEEMAAEALRRLFLKPGADRYRGFVEELAKGGKLALMLEKKNKSKKAESYVFKLFRLEESGKLVELEGVKLRIEKVGEGIVYALVLSAGWMELFMVELEMVGKAAEEVGGRLPVEDLFPYMLGWVASDVAINRKKSAKMLEMGTSHLWQLAETHALFGWSRVVVPGVGLTLEGPKPQFHAYTSLDKLDEAVRRSEWLKRLGVKVKSWYGFKQVESWDDLKSWAIENWRDVVEAAVRRLGGDAREELNALKGRLKDDKIAREAIAPALLLIQAEKLGVNEESLRYFGAVVSGAIGGDGYVSAARGEVVLASGEREIALLWGAALAAYGIKAEVRGAGKGFQVVAYDDNAIKLARLYFLFGPPLLEGRDERVINHKLAEAVELGAKGALNIRWEGARRTKGGRVAADLTISEGGVEVKYSVYLYHEIVLRFDSTDRSRAELAARLLRLAGVDAEVKKVGDRGVWRVEAATDMLAAGREELRRAIADIVKAARGNGWINEETADRWLEKLRSGITLREGWPKYHVGLNEGALEVRYMSTNPEGIEREAKRLRAWASWRASTSR